MITKISTLAAAMLAMLIATTASFASGEGHHIAFHVDQNDPQVMNMTLNNVQNVRKYYDSIGEKVTIEVVAYGPGLNMFREDKSPVKQRIAAMSLEISDLQFSACGNTLNKMQKKAGMDVPLISEATVVPSGVVQLITLQEKGYSYVRP
jgi:intracellular sulfur oxidation DsrE/DsrF family protein